MTKIPADKLRIYQNEPEYRFYYTTEQVNPLQKKVKSLIDFIKENTTFFDEGTARQSDYNRSGTAQDFVKQLSRVFITDYSPGLSATGYKPHLWEAQIDHLTKFENRPSVREDFIKIQRKFNELGIGEDIRTLLNTTPHKENVKDFPGPELY